MPGKPSRKLLGVTAARGQIITIEVAKSKYSTLDELRLVAEVEYIEKDLALRKKAVLSRVLCNGRRVSCIDSKSAGYRALRHMECWLTCRSHRFLQINVLGSQIFDRETDGPQRTNRRALTSPPGIHPRRRHTRAERRIRHWRHHRTQEH